jgi:O-antigen ligase/polysaccharide polymerase Wzy-like membrane protein
VSGLAQLGGPIACIGLALVLVLRQRRDRLAALAFAAAGTVLLGLSVTPHKPVLVAGGTFAALGLGVGLAWLFRSRPWLYPVLALACVPARVGVHVGGSSSKLLVPLYVVVIGAAILLAWQLVDGDGRSRELRLATWPLALLIAWTGVSLAWSKDVHEGAIEVLAFYVPFSLVALTFARLPWSRAGARILYAQVSLMALIFAVVGFYQYQTRDIFQNPKVITANAYAPFFRVNSVFWDPSVYGRFLVVAMTPSIVLVALGRSVRWSLLAGAMLVVTWFGLLISYSQSSFAALLVVVIGAAFLAWRWRALVAVVLAIAVLAGISVSQPQVRKSLQHHTTSGLNSATSGRASLVANGIRIAVHHPVLGVGVGGFKRAYAERVGLKGKEPKTAASHNTPVTIAAESGAVGLALFAWVVAAFVVEAVRRRRRSFSLVAGLALAAIFCHSLFYNAFFEDPMTWALFGLVVLAVPQRAPAAGVVPPVESQEAVPV